MMCYGRKTCSLLWACLVMMLICQLSADSAYGQTRAGSAFLKIPPGTRQQNMAGSMTAALDAPYSLFANPAATGFLREWHLATSLNYWIADIYSLSALAAKRIHGNLNLALGLNVQGVDQFDATGGLAPPASAQDILLSASLGLPFGFPAGRISLGSNVKYLYSDLAQFNASGVIFDAGVLYRTHRLPFLFGQKVIVSAGAAVNQLGRDLKFVLRPTPLPRTVKLGLGLNFGTHDGLQTQLTMDYQSIRDEDGRFAFGAEIVNPFNSHWGRALTVRGGYAFTGNQDTRLVSKVTFGLSLSFDDYMNSEQRARNAVFLPRNSALQADAGLLSSSSFDNPVQGSLSLKPIGPEHFNFYNGSADGAMQFDNKRPRFSFRPGSAVSLSWEQAGDPDLFDDVGYIVIGTRNDREGLQSLVQKIRTYEFGLDSLRDSMTYELLELAPASGIRASFSGSSDDADFESHDESSNGSHPAFPRHFFAMPTATDAKVQSLVVKPSLPGDYYWAVVAFDVHNRHVRVAGKSDRRIAHFTVAGAKPGPLLTPPLLPPPPPSLRVLTPSKPELTIEIEAPQYLPDVLFGPDSTSIATMSPYSKRILKAWIRQLRTLPDVNIEVAGHADTTGADSLNKHLARQRAENVKEALVKAGISRHRICAVGYRDSQPLPNDNLPEKLWLALNRRVELRLPIKVYARNTGVVPVRNAGIAIWGHTGHIAGAVARCETGHNGAAPIHSSLDLGSDSIDSLEITPKSFPLTVVYAVIDVDSVIPEINENNNIDSTLIAFQRLECDHASELRALVTGRKFVNDGLTLEITAKAWYEYDSCWQPWRNYKDHPVVQFERDSRPWIRRNDRGNLNRYAANGTGRYPVRHMLIFEVPHRTARDQLAGFTLAAPIRSDAFFLAVRDKQEAQPELWDGGGGHGMSGNGEAQAEGRKDTSMTVSGDTVIVPRLFGDTTPVEIRLRVPVTTIIGRDTTDTSKTGEPNSEPDSTLFVWLEGLRDIIYSVSLPDTIIQPLKDTLKVLERAVVKPGPPGKDLPGRIANLASMITNATRPPDATDLIPSWAWLLIALAVVSALGLVPVRAVQDYGRQDVRLRSASIIKTSPEQAPVSAQGKGTGGPDDLQRIEGIGPEIFDLLTANGITTFATLAQMTPEALQKILEAGDLKGKNPESWPEQAKLAALRRWRKLDEWQEKYKHGVKGKKTEAEDE